MPVSSCPPPSTAQPGSRGDEIQLIFSTLSATKDSEKYFLTLLSPDEQTRAASFRFAKDRTLFIVARGLLRILLGNFMNSPPAAIAFRYGPNGKPAIAGAPRIHFNLSHSGQMVLYGLRLDHEIGVDLERVRGLQDMESIARHFFSVAECHDLLMLAEKYRTKAFFDCWTRKEAFIKFLGTGFFYPLHRFQVTFAPGKPAELLHVDGRPPQPWFLRDVALDKYSAAIASEGPDGPFRVWKLESPDDGARLFK